MGEVQVASTVTSEGRVSRTLAVRVWMTEVKQQARNEPLLTRVPKRQTPATKTQAFLWEPQLGGRMSEGAAWIPGPSAAEPRWEWRGCRKRLMPGEGEQTPGVPERAWAEEVKRTPQRRGIPV